MSDAHTEDATIAPIAVAPALTSSTAAEHPAAPSATVALLDLPTAETHDLIYCCRKCRTALFRPSQLQAPHDTGKHSFAYRKMTKDKESDKAGGPSSACTSYFLQDALPWMADTSVDVEGKLTCYKCKARVGSLNWAGSQCSCGTWIAPAIQMNKKSVDERYFPKAASTSSGTSTSGAGDAAKSR